MVDAVRSHFWVRGRKKQVVHEGISQHPSTASETWLRENLWWDQADADNRKKRQCFLWCDAFTCKRQPALKPTTGTTSGVSNGSLRQSPLSDFVCWLPLRLWREKRSAVWSVLISAVEENGISNSEAKEEMIISHIFLPTSTSGTERRRQRKQSLPCMNVVLLTSAILRDTGLLHTGTQNGLMIKEVLMELVSRRDSCSPCQECLTRSSHHQGGQSGLSRAGRHNPTPQRPRALSALPEGHTQLAHMWGGRQDAGILLNSFKSEFIWKSSSGDNKHSHKTKWSTQVVLSLT